MARIRLLIVDDHTLFRESLRSHLGTIGGIDVVGEAGDGIEAFQKTMQLKPDLVLMDFAMPNCNGLVATRQIKSKSPSTKIIILTMYETGQHVQEILQAGASGYILKKASTRELVSAIQAVMQGEAFLCPSAAKQVLDEYTKQDTVTKQTKQNLLTNRELEVLNLVAEGKTSKEIADLLSISVRTVKTHRQHIMKKLDLHDRTELVRYAFRRGLIIP